jgi:hypothetical protein
MNSINIPLTRRRVCMHQHECYCDLIHLVISRLILRYGIFFRTEYYPRPLLRPPLPGATARGIFVSASTASANWTEKNHVHQYSKPASIFVWKVPDMSYLCALDARRIQYHVSRYLLFQCALFETVRGTKHEQRLYPTVWTRDFITCSSQILTGVKINLSI